jgi:hypothetical protein
MFGEMSYWEGTVDEVEQLNYIHGDSDGVRTKTLYKCYLSNNNDEESICTVSRSFPVRVNHKLRIIYNNNKGISVINLSNGAYDTFNSIQSNVIYLIFTLLPWVAGWYFKKVLGRGYIIPN